MPLPHGAVEGCVCAPEVWLGPSDAFWRRWGDPRPLEQLSSRHSGPFLPQAYQI